MLRRRPSLIVFDLDGTLVDSAPDLAHSIDAMLTRLGRPPAGEGRVRGWIGHGMPMLVKRALTGERLGVEPAQALMVGDSLADAEAARAAGFMFVAVPYGYHGGAGVAALAPDAVVENLAELPELVDAAPALSP